jgi:hypothetical protein
MYLQEHLGDGLKMGKLGLSDQIQSARAGEKDSTILTILTKSLELQTQNETIELQSV